MVSENSSLTVSVETAGKMLGISRGLAYELAGRGELPGLIRLGHRFVVSRRAIEKLLDGDSKAAEDLVNQNVETKS